MGRPPLPNALYRRIAKALRERMTRGEWAPGAVLPSMQSLAEEYGVGFQAVRRALDVLKLEGRIATNARRRLVATGVVGGHTGLQGYVLEVVADSLKQVSGSDYQMQMQAGLFEGLSESALPLVLAHDYRLIHHLPTDLLDGPLRGIILLAAPRPRALAAYEKLSVPVVLCDHPPEKWKLHACAVDNRPAAYDATRRLIALGHRRIALVRFASYRLSDFDADSRERQNGYRMAMRAHGLSSTRDMLFTATVSESEAGPNAQALFASKPPFTAILCAGQQTTEWAVRTARSFGLAVPRDISIAGFLGGGPSAFNLSGPRIDFREIGLQASRLVLQPRRPTQVIRVKVPWYEGATVGPPKKR